MFSNNGRVNVSITKEINTTYDTFSKIKYQVNHQL